MLLELNLHIMFQNTCKIHPLKRGAQKFAAHPKMALPLQIERPTYISVVELGATQTACCWQQIMHAGVSKTMPSFLIHRVTHLWSYFIETFATLQVFHHFAKLAVNFQWTPPTEALHLLDRPGQIQIPTLTWTKRTNNSQLNLMLWGNRFTI